MDRNNQFINNFIFRLYKAINCLLAYTFLCCFSYCSSPRTNERNTECITMSHLSNGINYCGQGYGNIFDGLPYGLPIPIDIIYCNKVKVFSFMINFCYCTNWIFLDVYKRQLLSWSVLILLSVQMLPVLVFQSVLYYLAIG